LNAPTVTVHYAQSLDGRIATKTRQSQWLSGQESLVFAHQLRADHDAVLVGIGTVLADDPGLTVRLAEGRSPLRVVVDSHQRIPMASRLLTDRASRTIVATTESASPASVEAIEALGAEVLIVPGGADGRVDLAALLAELGKSGVRSVLVEGGRDIITSFLRLSLVDRLVVCIAPKIVGAGTDAVGDLGIDNLSRALTFGESRFTPLGRDMIFDGVLEKRNGTGA
jgi:diaminohydroxyphosphoribosylaminopyrimidine deaminase / 5-amino-6-(5-phosphoribosylamino)uracil reductase